MNEKTQQELVMLIKRLSFSLRSARPESKLPDAAMRYLSAHGLISVNDCLRTSQIHQRLREPGLYKEDEQL